MSESQTAEQLRPLLHGKIDHMDAAHLALLNRVMLQLEAEEVAERLGAAFDEDERSGRMDRLPEIIRECREQHRAA